MGQVNVAYDDVAVFSNSPVRLDFVRLPCGNWESGEQKDIYLAKAESVLRQYHDAVSELNVLRLELADWEPLEWDDVFHPEDALRGVNYDGVKVQTSRIADEPYQLVARAETEIEKNERIKRGIERSIAKEERRMNFSLRMLELLRGDTREVARLRWYSDMDFTLEEISVKLDMSLRKVYTEKANAIETVGRYLWRREVRSWKDWFL